MSFTWWNCARGVGSGWMPFGHETTSGLLTFAIHMLLEHPDIMRKAQEEVDRVFGDETPRQELVAKLTYIDQILRETLRLWPTAPAFVMTPKHDTLLAGHYPVKARDVLLLLLPALHRDPAVWEDPHKFDPDRWAAGKRESIPPHAWKPFGTGELMARIRVALRHAKEAGAGPIPDVIEVGTIRIDQPRHEVTVDGAIVHLTPIEFKILLELARQAGRVLTHAQLSRAVWGATPVEQGHTLRVHVAAVRRKIERDPARPQWLVTETGVGYRLRDAIS